MKNPLRMTLLSSHDVFATAAHAYPLRTHIHMAAVRLRGAEPVALVS